VHGSKTVALTAGSPSSGLRFGCGWRADRSDGSSLDDGLQLLLLDTGEALRVIVRNLSALPAESRDRVEVVEGSHRDAAVVEEAFAGADAVFWLAPPD
jgi:hypothetical protein